MDRSARLEPIGSQAQRFAIEAVARHFSVVWQHSEEPDAYITLAGRQVAIDVAVVRSPHTHQKRPIVKPRLRDDAVARRVLRDLERAMHARVPDGKTVILTLGAPIIEPKKLLAALTEMLLAYLEGGAKEIDEKKTILKNRVRFRVLNGNRLRTAKVVGFVFTGDPKPGVLVDALQSLHDAIAASAKKRGSKMSGERWLVLVSDRWIADIKTYRRAYSYLSSPGRFKKILMVLESGRVEDLAEA